MSFEGTLGTIPLTDLLQWVALSRRSGCLRLERERKKARIYFRDGRIVASSSDDPPTLLGQVLLFRGDITEEALRLAMEAQAETGQSLTDILPAMDAATPEQLDAAVASKTEETLLSLFEWGGEAAFTFEPDEPPDPKAARISVDIADLALRGMKRLDDRKRCEEIFGNLRSIPRKTGGEEGRELLDDWSTRRVYLVADGKRTVRDIILLVHGTEAQVMGRLLDLHGRGMIEVLPAVDVPDQPSEPAQAAAPPPGTEAPKEPLPAPAGPDACSHSAADLDLARRLVTQGSYESALALLNRMCSEDPNHDCVKRLIAHAEEALTIDLAQQGFLPMMVPVPSQPLEMISQAEKSPEEEFLLSLIADGSWDIKGLAFVSPMRSVEILLAVKRLVDRGWVTLQRPDPRSSKAPLERPVAARR